MAYTIKEFNKDCGCNTCSTWATITEYSCGCIKVKIYNDSKPTGHCTDFNGKCKYCEKSGSPEGH